MKKWEFSARRKPQTLRIPRGGSRLDFAAGRGRDGPRSLGIFCFSCPFPAQFRQLLEKKAGSGSRPGWIPWNLAVEDPAGKNPNFLWILGFFPKNWPEVPQTQSPGAGTEFRDSSPKIPPGSPKIPFSPPQILQRKIQGIFEEIAARGPRNPLYSHLNRGIWVFPPVEGIPAFSRSGSASPARSSHFSGIFGTFPTGNPNPGEAQPPRPLPADKRIQIPKKNPKSRLFPPKIPQIPAFSPQNIPNSIFHSPKKSQLFPQKSKSQLFAPKIPEFHSQLKSNSLFLFPRDFPNYSPRYFLLHWILFFNIISPKNKNPQ